MEDTATVTDEFSETMPHTNGQDVSDAVSEYTIALPQLTLGEVDAETVDAFEAQLATGLSLRVLGTVGIAKDWRKLQEHSRLVSGFWQHMQMAVNRINGVPSTSMKLGHKKKTLRSVTQNYMESLSTPMLRKQAELFKIDYDSFETQEAIINALVEKHIEMVEVA